MLVRRPNAAPLSFDAANRNNWEWGYNRVYTNDRKMYVNTRFCRRKATSDDLPINLPDFYEVRQGFHTGLFKNSFLVCAYGRLP